MTNESQVNRASVERKVQQLFGPEVMGSDFTWDSMGLNAGRYWRLYPLRERVQTLARKYRKRPSTFYRKFQQILIQRDRKLAKDPSQSESIAWYNELRRRVNEALALALPQPTEETIPEQTAGLLLLPEHFTRRQVKAVDQILAVLEAPLIGRPPAVTNPKKVIDAFKSLVARRPGRPSEEQYDTALKILRSGKYPKRPIHYICLQLVPGYSGLPVLEQEKERRKMKAGIKRHEHLQKGTKSLR
jgi:hypothetical protein